MCAVRAVEHWIDAHFGFREDVKRGIDMAGEEANLMQGTTEDGRTIYWFDQPPYLLGDTSLIAEVETQLYMESLDGGVLVTPTGPWVVADESNPLAVFGAANLATSHTITWKNPPDVLGDIPEGAADGPSPVEEEDAGVTASAPNPRAPMVRAANEARSQLGQTRLVPR